MSLKQKITISNIIIICVPVLLAVVLVTVYIFTHNGIYLNPIEKNDSNSMRNMQYTLYLYEGEIAALDFEKISSSDYNETDVLLPPQMMRIQELSEIGFHLQIKCDDNILFSNMDDTDAAEINNHPLKKSKSRETLEYFQDKMIIRNSIEQNGKEYLVTAVYNQDRVNVNVQESMLPIYLISPQLLAAFILIVSASIIATNILLIRWLNRSIIKPLNILTSGAQKISEGNLDIPIEYGQQDEFGVVCREFDGMRVKLKNSRAARERYENNRRNMISGISHDLRSPLTSIKGYTEGLRDGIAGTDAKKERYYNAIMTRTDDMERLLDSMSTLVRLDNPDYSYNFEVVRIDDFIRQFIKDEEAYAEQNKLSVKYINNAAESEAAIDVREMRRVFVNLLENSVKYREESSVEVLIETKSNKKQGTVVISFSDNGPGVNENQLEYIFDSFYRADESRTKPENGSGLGLAVVKSIVEGHKGKVRAVNNGGLCILITLPGLWGDN